MPTEAAMGCVDTAFGAHHAAIVGVIDALSQTEADCAADVLSRIADALDALD